jgi:hypothetical protein
MKIKSILICAGIFSIGLVSCKKDSNGSSKDVEGTWNFAGLFSKTEATNTENESGSITKTVTSTAYNTTNNSGTIKFSGGTLTSTAIAYSVDTTAYVSEYQDDVLLDSFSYPFMQDIPASGATSGYALVGKDSITFTSAGIVGANASESPSGGHYSIDGNKMNIVASLVKDSSYTDQSVLFTIHQAVDVQIFLEK